jgi:4a-hydroxytetrahydrobiopterin dehydratase
MKPLNKDEITEFLALHLNGWSFDGNFIKRDFEFKNFVEAFSFMTAVALEAEKKDHHPDWNNEYNKVQIKLRTHSADGVTGKDIDLAQNIDSLYKSSGKG